MIELRIAGEGSSLPTDWQMVKLGQVLQRVRGPVEVKADKTYHEIGIRSHGKGIFYKEPTTGAALGEKAVFWVQPDCFIVNIVFAWEQAVAKTTTNEVGMIASHRFPMYKPKDGALDLDYVLRFFKTPQGKYLLGLASPGGAGRNKTLGQEAFLELSIPLPPYPEQRKIAAILGTWDEAIALTERRIAAGQQRKQGLMQRLLTGQVRFREFVQSTGIRRTELGTYPQDWPVQRLSDVATVRLSNVDKKMAPGERVVRLCNYTNVFRKDYIDNRSVFMSGSAAESEVERFSLKKEDVLLTKDSGTREEIAEVAVVAIDAKDLVCGYHLAILRPNSSMISGFFLKEALRSGNVHNQFVRSANGITRYGLTLSVIENALTPVPPAAEQNRITEVLAACDRELDLLARKRDALQRQKRGLMQQLLTGRVRVAP
jgi:type I restriction enzyme, S subunit